MRVAVIGAGPSGFFVAGEILKRCPGCEVHLLEKRVAPYGLVRYGVAPDHLPTRRAIKLFDQIADHARFLYFGNVEVGRDVLLDTLRQSYHAVVLCSGAEVPNRPDLPGARLRGAADALDLARWANGEAEAFDAAWLDGVRDVVIIGNGNVALDAARLFLRGAATWVATDIAPYAMEALAHHRAASVTLVGRRAAAEASFTEAEWSEVVGLPGWSVATDEPFPFGPLPEKPGSDHHLVFRNRLRTACLLGGERVVGARFAHADTGATVELPAQLVVFATGHRAPKWEGLPYDATRGVIPNRRGSVTGAPGVYVCGWIKRGAKGLIGLNRKDAIETVAAMLDDLEVLAARQPDPPAWIAAARARGVRLVTWSDWKRIDAAETARGAALGRPRLPLGRADALAVLETPDRT
ncbi:MAG TPA: FAD-dependent oxidoreductase [Kiritimatiellia bacterium]|nr:FAD-dependent oxidoreductase [Kiritimatiellia bacterium]HMP35779.1 FAD-dependent oxidoreductase [Kiritimatiellia bacterium]